MDWERQKTQAKTENQKNVKTHFLFKTVQKPTLKMNGCDVSNHRSNMGWWKRW